MANFTTRYVGGHELTVRSHMAGCINRRTIKIWNCFGPISEIGDLEIVGRSGSALRPNVFSLHVKNNGIHNYGIEGWPFRALNLKQLILHRLQNITRCIVFYRLLEAC